MRSIRILTSLYEICHRSPTHTTIQETQRYISSRQQLLAAMDPTLQEYLDAMRKDTPALKESIASSRDAVMEKQEAMTR